MSVLPENDVEKRLYPRIAINGEAKYKLDKNAEYKNGMMINLSQNGVLICLDQELPTETRMTLLMQSDNDDEAPVEITIEIVRVVKRDNDGAHNYGCKILNIKDL